MSCSATGERTKRVMPPTYLLIAIVAVIAARVLAPAWVVSNLLTLAAGCGLLGVGIALNLSADAAFKRASTPVSPDARPTAIQTTGAFGYTRNPMYLGMASIVAGLALLIGAPIGLLVAGGFVLVMDRAFVPREEIALREAFGGAYAEYARAVHRWI